MSVERVDAIRDEAIRDVAEALAARWSRERLTNDSDPEYDAEAAVDCLLAAGWRPADGQVEAERDALRGEVEEVRNEAKEAWRWLNRAEMVQGGLLDLPPERARVAARQAVTNAQRLLASICDPPAADSGTPPAKEDA